MKSRFFRARARNRTRNRTRNRYFFYLLCLKKTIPITMEYNPAFDAGMSSKKEIFA